MALVVGQIVACVANDGNTRPGRVLAVNGTTLTCQVSGIAPDTRDFTLDSASPPVTPGTWHLYNVAAQTTLDFGAGPVRSKGFQISESACYASSLVDACLSANVSTTGRNQDELEMIQLDLRCYPGAGFFYIFATSLNGFISGQYVINYRVEN